MTFLYFYTNNAQMCKVQLSRIWSLKHVWILTLEFRIEVNPEFSTGKKSTYLGPAISGPLNKEIPLSTSLSINKTWLENGTCFT